MPQPWRIMMVRAGNDPRAQRFDPWLHLEFVNQSDRVECGFEVVGIDEADQLEREEAKTRLARFAAASLRDVFLLVPPEGFDFDAVYKPAQIIEGAVIAEPKQIAE